MFWAAAAAVGYLAAVVVLALGLSAFIPELTETEGTVPLLASWLPVVVAAFAVNWVLVRRGWASWRDLGWRGGSADSRALVEGLAIGLAMGVVVVLLMMALGDARVAFTGESLAAYLRSLWPWGVTFAVAGLGEELLFRGYPLRRLAAGVGPAGASVVLSAGFAALHLANPSVVALGIVNVGLASLVLSAAFLTPGGLPMAWGLHVGWNAGIGLVVDAPVSGITLELPAVEYVAGDPRWMSGGAFGPEGGVAATIVLGVTLIWLARRAAAAGEEAT